MTIRSQMQDITNEDGLVIARRYSIYFENEQPLPDAIISAVNGQTIHYQRGKFIDGLLDIQRFVIDMDA